MLSRRHAAAARDVRNGCRCQSRTTAASRRPAMRLLACDEAHPSSRPLRHPSSWWSCLGSRAATPQTRAACRSEPRPQVPNEKMPVRASLTGIGAKGPFYFLKKTVTYAAVLSLLSPLNAAAPWMEQIAHAGVDPTVDAWWCYATSPPWKREHSQVFWLQS